MKNINLAHRSFFFTSAFIYKMQRITTAPPRYFNAYEKQNLKNSFSLVNIKLRRCLHEASLSLISSNDRYIYTILYKCVCTIALCASTVAIELLSTNTVETDKILLLLGFLFNTPKFGCLLDVQKPQQKKTNVLQRLS